MIFAFQNRKGINKIVDDTLKGLPQNQRFDKANMNVSETIPYKVKVIPAHSSYFQEGGGKSRIDLTVPYKKVRDVIGTLREYEQEISKNVNGTSKIELVGPYEDVPNFAVASSEDERKIILNISNNEVFGVKQKQLIVLDNGVFFRYLKLNGASKEISVQNVQGVYLSRSSHFSKNKQNRQLDENKFDLSSQISDSNETYKKGIGIPGIWEGLVESMTNHFLNTRLFTTDSIKVIYGSEGIRDKLIDVFEKEGLKPVETYLSEGHENFVDSFSKKTLIFKLNRN